jgi:hypothetical protein
MVPTNPIPILITSLESPLKWCFGNNGPSSIPTMAPPKMHAKTIGLITRVFTVPDPEILARGAEAAEPAPPWLGMETRSETGQLTSRWNCRSRARRVPKLCPLAPAQPKQVRGHCPYTQIASGARAPDPLVLGRQPDRNGHSGSSFSRGRCSADS